MRLACVRPVLPTADPRSETTATIRPDPTGSRGWTHQSQADAGHRRSPTRRATPSAGPTATRSNGTAACNLDTAPGPRRRTSAPSRGEC
jgi:hypothetical protein